jgi:hypothetical protein
VYPPPGFIKVIVAKTHISFRIFALRDYSLNVTDKECNAQKVKMETCRTDLCYATCTMKAYGSIMK